MTDMVSRSVGRLGSHHADAATSGPFIESSMNPRISFCLGSQRAGELTPLIYAFLKPQKPFNPSANPSFSLILRGKVAEGFEIQTLQFIQQL